MENRQSKKNVLKLSVFAYIPIGILMLLMSVLGAVFQSKTWNIEIFCTIKICEIVALVLPPVLLVIGLYQKKCYQKKWDQGTFAKERQFLIEQRSKAQDVTEQQLKVLPKIRKSADNRARLLIACSVIGAIFAGILGNAAAYIIVAIYMEMGLSRLCFRKESDPFILGDNDLSKEKYPYLYQMAERARDALHCSGDIVITVTGECNIGIKKVAGYYNIELGVMLAGIESEDELFAMFLHEFAHMKEEEQDGSGIEYEYRNWLLYGMVESNLQAITEWMFLYQDTRYQCEFELYEYASSLMKELKADQSMASVRQAAASGLLKLFYFDVFSWEEQGNNFAPLYAPKQPSSHFVTEQIDYWQQQLSKREVDWRNLMEHELPAQSDSHPTTKMRLDALWITSYQLVKDTSCDAYRKEQKAVCGLMDELIYCELSEEYEENRKEQYLEPYRQIQEWKDKGQPILQHEYAGILDALLQVGEVEAALLFCDRVIRELPPEISAYAYFTKGRILIRRYDERAIELIYHAIENNSNLIQSGLDEIGYFCCLIGNRAELERYRKTADELMQKNEDEYRQLGILTPSDQLEREELPDGKLDIILSYIQSVDENQIQHIWLVRKILPTGMASSVFIVQFKKECPPDQQEAIYQKLFCYLDTLDDRCYSLILYDKLMCKNFKKVKESCVY